MSRPAWLTEADLAELAVACQVFVRDLAEHRDRCAVCGPGGRWCEHATAAFDALLVWWQLRERLSWAAWLRAPPKPWPPVCRFSSCPG